MYEGEEAKMLLSIIIIIALLLMIILQLSEIINRLPKRDHVKEAMERDKAKRKEEY